MTPEEYDCDLEDSIVRDDRARLLQQTTKALREEVAKLRLEWELAVLRELTKQQEEEKDNDETTVARRERSVAHQIDGSVAGTD